MVQKYIFNLITKLLSHNMFLFQLRSEYSWRSLLLLTAREKHDADYAK